MCLPPRRVHRRPQVANSEAPHSLLSPTYARKRKTHHGFPNRFTLLPRLLTNAQDKPAALRLTQSLAADYPKVPEANFAVARMAANAGDDRLALEEVRKARRLRPDWESAVLLEAQLVQKTSADQAAAILADYLQKYPPARDYHRFRQGDL